MVRVSSYLLCSVGLTFFCLCATQPNNPSETTHPIKPVVLWKTGEDHSGPEEVDSMRFTVFSADGNFTDTIQKTFHFDDHQAKINVPAGSRLTLKVEGLDEEGFVVYKGTVLVDDASDQDITIVLDATHVTPRSPSSFSVIALSTCNFYLSWKDRSNNETGFIIQHRDNDDFVNLDTVKGKTVYLHSSVKYADYQTYRIFAFNNAGTSDTISYSVQSPQTSITNKAPQFLQSSDQISGILYPDQTKKIILTAFDPDCDHFSITVSPVLSRSEDTLIWTPTISDIGENRLWAAATDDLGASDTLFWTWDVKDTVRPTITLLKPDTMYLATGDRYVDPGMFAEDNVDGDISDKVEVSEDVNTSLPGTYLLTYSVSDRFGNEAETQTRIVHVLPGSFPDKIPPVIFLVGGDIITINQGEDYTDPGFYALDNREDSTSITNKIEVSGKVDTQYAGTYQIVYRVEDSSGNKSQKVRYVEVVPAPQSRKSEL
jgi:hypothetical protein